MPLGLVEAALRNLTIDEPDENRLTERRDDVLRWVASWRDDPKTAPADRDRYAKLGVQLESCGAERAVWLCSCCRSATVALGYCRSRVCPLCAKKRADAFKRSRAELVTRYAYPFHAVFTQRARAGEPMKAAFDRLRETLRSWRKRDSVKRIVAAGVYSIEIAGPDRHVRDGKVFARHDWHHVHAHAVINAARVVGRGIVAERGGLFFSRDLETIRDAWREESGERDGDVPDGSFTVWRLRTSELARERWLSEIVKYIYKPAVLTSAFARELYDTLHGARFGGTWGGSYGVQVRPDPPRPCVCGSPMTFLGWRNDSALTAIVALANVWSVSGDRALDILGIDVHGKSLSPPPLPDAMPYGHVARLRSPAMDH